MPKNIRKIICEHDETAGELCGECAAKKWCDQIEKEIMDWHMNTCNCDYISDEKVCHKCGKRRDQCLKQQ